MKGQTAIEYLMTYGWAILIILIVAGVLAYYGIFAPSGFLGPTARGFGQLQVLNPWSFSAATGALTLNIENRVGGTIQLTSVNNTVDTVDFGKTLAITDCTSGCIGGPGASTNVTSGGKAVISTTGGPDSGAWDTDAHKPGDSFTTTITIYYTYQGGAFSSTGTLSGTYS